MGASESTLERQNPPMLLVQPVLDFPPAAARTRMLVPAYELMFGKLPLRCLFEDYFDQAGKSITPRIMLKPLDDPRADLTATMSTTGGEALFRFQRDLDEPHTFMDFLVSTSNPMLQLRSSAYYPKYHVGAFGTFPLLMANRACSEDYGVMGVRYGSENLSIGASFVPFPLSGEIPYGAWLVGRRRGFSAGVQYKPLRGSMHPTPFTDLKNWNCAISYGVGSTSPLSPSSIFSLELIRSTQLVASFYQHMVVQRRVNPHEDDHVIGTTNYIDFGLELARRVDKDKPTDDVENPLFQIAASWQANKNLLVKGKLGPSKSSVTLAFKSWWNPTCTFSVAAVTDHLKGTMSYGFGIRVDDLSKTSYQNDDINYMVLPRNKDDSPPDFLQEHKKKKHMFKSDNVPTWFVSIDEIL